MLFGGGSVGELDVVMKRKVPIALSLGRDQKERKRSVKVLKNHLEGSHPRFEASATLFKLCLP